MTKPAPTTHTENAEALFERRMNAVSEAIDCYHRYLKNYLFGLTRHMQDAENLAQELWRYVLLHFDEDKIGALPLLRRKAYQLFVDHYRRLLRRGETLIDEVPETPVRPVAREAYTEAEEQALKKRFWSEYPEVDLTDEQKEVLWRHARYGFTYREIEEQLSIPASTVGDWIALGRKRLAETINVKSKS